MGLKLTHLYQIQKIEVLGPPPSSGTRDALTALVLKKGAASFGITDKAIYKAVREDGAFIEAGENDNLIVRKLSANPNAFGIFGYSFLEENSTVIQASDINGVSPDYHTIASFEYPVARYLFIIYKTRTCGEYSRYDGIFKRIHQHRRSRRRWVLGRPWPYFVARKNEQRSCQHCAWFKEKIRELLRYIPQNIYRIKLKRVRGFLPHSYTFFMVSVYNVLYYRAL